MEELVVVVIGLAFGFKFEVVVVVETFSLLPAMLLLPALSLDFVAMILCFSRFRILLVDHQTPKKRDHGRVKKKI